MELTIDGTFGTLAILASPLLAVVVYGVLALIAEIAVAIFNTARR